MILGSLGVVLMLAVVTLAIVAVMAAVLYGSRALGWGLDRYPRSAALVTLILILGVFLAAVTFNRVFPGCDFHWACSAAIVTQCIEGQSVLAADRGKIRCPINLRALHQ